MLRVQRVVRVVTSYHFPVHCLTRHRFPAYFQHSCWPKTSRCLVGMVRFGRILGKNGFSSHVWLHCELPGCRNALLLARRSLGLLGYIYCDFQKDIDLAIILSNECTSRTSTSSISTRRLTLVRASVLAGPRVPAYSIIVAYHVGMLSVCGHHRVASSDQST
jgi:hypothetical protein